MVWKPKSKEGSENVTPNVVREGDEDKDTEVTHQHAVDVAH